MAGNCQNTITGFRKTREAGVRHLISQDTSQLDDELFLPKSYTTLVSIPERQRDVGALDRLARSRTERAGTPGSCVVCETISASIPARCAFAERGFHP